MLIWLVSAGLIRKRETATLQTRRVEDAPRFPLRAPSRVNPEEALRRGQFALQFLH